MGQKMIMLVDDDNDDRGFFCSAVKKIDPSCVCLLTENGKDALEKLRNAPQLPDLIFLDLNMPVMNGVECLKELKKDALLKNIPVIIYSTSVNQEDMNRTKQLGASHYLVKPFDTNTLPDEIAKVIAMNF